MHGHNGDLDDEDYTYPPLRSLVRGGVSVSVGKADPPGGGCVTVTTPDSPLYPPPPYDRRAYPAGPDCRTHDEKTAAQIADLQTSVSLLAHELAALREEVQRYAQP